MTICRICKTGSAAPKLGNLKSPACGNHNVYECQFCGCRFAEHDNAVYDTLHAQTTSVYAPHEEIAMTAYELFRDKDASGLKAYLSLLPKNAFIIDSIEALPDCQRVMEMGCSKGYLTAFFILSGYDMIGVDVSETAVNAAAKRFGANFATPDSDRIDAGAPYDAIYHVGTIGCVDEPLAFTRGLIEKLRPGGQLVFNAPNTNACQQSGTLWATSAFPPDLVTMFDPGIWAQEFSQMCKVEVAENTIPRRRIVKSMLKSIISPSPTGARGHATLSSTGTTKSKRVSLWRRRLDEFGMFVKMTKL